MQGPNANDITVPEVLAKLDSDFAAMAMAVENGEFALWVGSGISQRQAPDLGKLIERAVEYLRARAVDPATAPDFQAAFFEAIDLARVQRATAEQFFSEPFTSWPIREEIVRELWNNYSKLLDIRITQQASDFMLWEAVDVRDAFEGKDTPGTEHLCIAILVLEGAVKSIASANWDGFIEISVSRLSGASRGVLQVVVDPNQMREAAGKARLLKFHGCILYATQEPETFRTYLTGSKTQITEWPDDHKFAAMRNAMIELATNQKALVLGLSIQDANIQGIFSKAKAVNPWPWPCAPQAPAHVFCEDQLADGQKDVLKVVYGESYNQHLADISKSSHIRAWAEQVLLALVMKLLTDKLARLMQLGLDSMGKPPELFQHLAVHLKDFRDELSGLAMGDRTEFTTKAIALWSRVLSIFRIGQLPDKPNTYEVLSPSPLASLDLDQNARSAGLGNLAIALSLFQQGRDRKLWALHAPKSGDIDAGVATALADWDGATERPLFFVKSAGEAIKLKQLGALDTSGAIVIHADDLWHQMHASRGGARRAKGAPGRTGRVDSTHVCMGQILDACDNIDELGRRFVAAVTL